MGQPRSSIHNARLVVSPGAARHPSRMNGCWLYILRCADGLYYVGTTRHADPQTRVSEHNQGDSDHSFTGRRRPVVLVFAEWFEDITAAVVMERQVKGWRREKKEALISGQWDRLPELARRKGARNG